MNMFLLTCTAFCLVASATAAGAADSATRTPAGTVPSLGATARPVHKTPHTYTLDEARKSAHEYAAKLDKMTPQEWDEMLKRRQEAFEKWKLMTPQERKAYLNERAAKVHTQ